MTFYHTGNIEVCNSEQINQWYCSVIFEKTFWLFALGMMMMTNFLVSRSRAQNSAFFFVLDLPQEGNLIIKILHPRASKDIFL